MSDFVIPQTIQKEVEKIQLEQAKKEAKQLREAEKELEELFPEIDVSEEELLKFWDTMLKKEPFKETYKIRDTEVEFKTRSTKEVHEMFEKLDSSTYALETTNTKFHLDLMLASSLVRFGEDDISSGSLEQKIGYLKNLPAPVVKLLVDLLDKFDRKIVKMTEMLKKGNF